jgi:hypothetical protein
MRSELSKECRKLFRKMMASEFPDYREDKGQISPPGIYVWTWQHPSGVWFHISLLIHQRDDRFTLEVAWDLDGKLPAFEIVCDEMETIFQRPLLFRIDCFWCRQDYWWKLVLRPEEYDRKGFYKDDPIEECLPLVAPAVSDAGKKLKEYIVPTFEKIIQIHGKKPV